MTEEMKEMKEKEGREGKEGKEGKYGAPLRDMRTARLRTRVYRAGEQYLWRREVLLDNSPPSVFPPLPPGVAVAMAEYKGGGTYEYRVPGGLSLGHRIWPPVAQTGPHEPLAQAMDCVGRALRSLHVQGPVLPAPRLRPPPITRLSRWLRSADDPAHHRLTAVLGSSRVQEVSAWCDAVADPAPTPRTLLHGEPSVGVIVPTPASPGALLLTGETLTHGPAAFDIGWLLGELAEMARLSDAAHTPLFADLAAALLAGYGPLDFDPALLSLTAGLRSVVHVSDYATYVGWNDALEHSIALLPDLVDTAGRAALDAVGVQLSALNSSIAPSGTGTGAGRNG